MLFKILGNFGFCVIFLGQPTVGDSLGQHLVGTTTSRRRIGGSKENELL
jgi:hypothetical protein